jgi:hypothetical protein
MVMRVQTAAVDTPAAVLVSDSDLWGRRACAAGHSALDANGAGQ